MQIEKHNSTNPLYGLGAQRLFVGKVIAIEHPKPSPRFWLEPAYWIQTPENTLRENDKLEVWTHNSSDSTGLAIGDWLIVRCQRGLKSDQNFLEEKLVWKPKHPSNQNP